ncbi:MAG: GntR family transcriptional regulator [Clostridiales bacterium]|nr:GntR family transcriptional regulator [Clostridiales bacterium]
MVEFNDNKPIYRQIVDYAFNCILNGEWRPGEMIPSVRELTGELCVNNRTVLKALDELQVLDVIESKRGMGFLLGADAVEKVRHERRREFIEVTVPQIVAEMKALGITKEELVDMLR